MGTKKEFIRRSVKNIYLYKHHQLCRKQPHVFLKDVAAAVHIMHTELQTNSTAPAVTTCSRDWRQGPLTQARREASLLSRMRVTHTQLVFLNAVLARTVLVCAQHNIHLEFLLHQIQLLPLVLWFILSLRSWPPH